MRLANEMAAIQRVDWDAKRLEVRCKSLEDDLDHARRVRAELESELVGARLDAKYLDKELAGRIQQIQILLAANTSQDHKQKVWGQIEAEMHLQRSKTISNMCYSKQKVRDSARKEMAVNDSDSGVPEEDGGGGGGRLKQVHLHKHDADELGMAILGGKEHGLPIMISEIFPDSSVSRSKKISAGDVIVAVNGDSFQDMTHNDAVRYLSSLRGTIRFDLENTVEADIDKVCDMDSRYYDFYEPEEVSPKSPVVQRLVLNNADEKSPAAAPAPNHDLPQVHSSPHKKVGDTK